MVKKNNFMQKTKLTPLLKQYIDIKEKFQDCLIFFRLGDFYELFFEDAEVAAKNLNITLTKRGSIEGKDIPMCGVPHHQGETYLARLLQKGFKVAICEQMEKPEESKKRGNKEIIKRQVVRIATPGTLTEEKELETPDNNFLFTFCVKNTEITCSWVDISTGEVNLKNCENEDILRSTISSVAPSELLVSKELIEKNDSFKKILSQLPIAITSLEPKYFYLNECKKYIAEAYSNNLNLLEEENIALGGIIKYIAYTQNGKIPPLQIPYKNSFKNYMEIDASSINNLEIIKTLSGERKGSLLNSVNYTKTSAGLRMLVNDLLFPLTDIYAINFRQNLIEFFIQNYNKLELKINDNFKKFPDITRSLARISLGRGGPRDLYSILNGLKCATNINQVLKENSSNSDNLKLKKFLSIICNHKINEILKLLDSALEENLPLRTREGNFIRKGYDEKLDEIRDFRDNRKKMVLEIEEREKKASKINSLKIKYNTFLGYFIDVTPAHQKVIKNYPNRYIHRQTLKNSLRYTTSELIDVSENITRFNFEASEIEYNIFNNLVNAILNSSESIIKISNLISRLDVSMSWTLYAQHTNAVRPLFSTRGDFEILKGRHPSVEKTHTENFIPNDCILKENGKSIFKLITGPNMSGKSTYLRQNALILIIAQAGGFCPADKAVIGICDKLFCRVGSGDELAKGNSTFMVEMTETARILTQATEKSFVILDEIGRGTSTFDGMSIAWAIVEFIILKIKCKTLFASHYTELSELSKKYKNLQLNTFRVKEWEDDLVFLHEITDGVAESSYGIQVAKMAGVPRTVIDSALKILGNLENEKYRSYPSKQLHINYNRKNTKKIEMLNNESSINNLVKELVEIDINSLSPLEALNKLSQFKKKLGLKNEK